MTIHNLSHKHAKAPPVAEEGHPIAFLIQMPHPTPPSLKAKANSQSGSDVMGATGGGGGWHLQPANCVKTVWISVFAHQGSAR
jgi:hypothetical protein